MLLSVSRIGGARCAAITFNLLMDAVCVNYWLWTRSRPFTHGPRRPGSDSAEWSDPLLNHRPNPPDWPAKNVETLPRPV
jgi:hypothetical protein